MSMNTIQRDVACAGMRERKPEKFSGFTLVELITVVAIIGVLSAIIVPLYAEYIDRAKIVRAISDIVNISKSITSYNFDNSKYPESLDEVGYGDFQDPWGAPYQYLNIQTALAAHGHGPQHPWDAPYKNLNIRTALSAHGHGPQHPWGVLYQYLNIQTALAAHGHGPQPRPRKDRFVHPINSDYDLYSMGKDGQSVAALTAHPSKDDVIRANDGAYIGLASQF